MTEPSRIGPRERRIPEGDDRERLVCPDCGHIAYENPKLVCGVVATASDGRIVLCRRAIEPRAGYWTLPAGYMELGETTAEGAAREAWEEARCRLAMGPLIAIYDIPRISQVQMFYRARLVDDRIAAGPESTDVRLVTWDQIPWDDLAFPTVRWALEDWRAGKDDPDPMPSLRQQSKLVGVAD